MLFASSGFPPVADDAKPESTPHAACAAHLETSAAEPFFGGEENRFPLGNISIPYEFPSLLLLPALLNTPQFWSNSPLSLPLTIYRAPTPAAP
jgi:hypothetical protein